MTRTNIKSPGSSHLLIKKTYDASKIAKPRKLNRQSIGNTRGTTCKFSDLYTFVRSVLLLWSANRGYGLK